MEMYVWVDIFVDKCLKTVAKIQGIKWFIYAKTSDTYKSMCIYISSEKAMPSHYYIYIYTVNNRVKS